MLCRSIELLCCRRRRRVEAAENHDVAQIRLERQDFDGLPGLARLRAKTVFDDVCCNACLLFACEFVHKKKRPHGELCRRRTRIRRRTPVTIIQIMTGKRSQTLARAEQIASTMTRGGGKKKVSSTMCATHL